MVGEVVDLHASGCFGWRSGGSRQLDPLPWGPCRVSADPAEVCGGLVTAERELGPRLLALECAQPAAL